MRRNRDVGGIDVVQVFLSCNHDRRWIFCAVQGDGPGPGHRRHPRSAVSAMLPPHVPRHVRPPPLPGATLTARLLFTIVVGAACVGAGSKHLVAPPPLVQQLQQAADGGGTHAPEPLDTDEDGDLALLRSPPLPPPPLQPPGVGAVQAHASTDHAAAQHVVRRQITAYCEDATTKYQCNKLIRKFDMNCRWRNVNNYCELDTRVRVDEATLCNTTSNH